MTTHTLKLYSPNPSRTVSFSIPIDNTSTANEFALNHKHLTTKPPIIRSNEPGAWNRPNELMRTHLGDTHIGLNSVMGHQLTVRCHLFAPSGSVEPAARAGWWTASAVTSCRSLFPISTAPLLPHTCAHSSSVHSTLLGCQHTRGTLVWDIFCHSHSSFPVRVRDVKGSV